MKQLSRALFTKADRAVKTDEDLIALTLVASILASFGIVLNNDFILIGSMLIAPFFHPLLSLATYIAGEKPKKIMKSVLTLFAMSFIAFIISLLTYAFLSLFREINPVYLIVGTQLEYFFVALTLGVVGALLWMWPKIPNISAGISIGISLVPPLSNSAKSIFLQNFGIFQESLISYSINVVGILIGAVVTIFIRNRILEKKVKKSDL